MLCCILPGGSRNLHVFKRSNTMRGEVCFRELLLVRRGGMCLRCRLLFLLTITKGVKLIEKVHRGVVK